MLHSAGILSIVYNQFVTGLGRSRCVRLVEKDTSAAAVRCGGGTKTTRGGNRC